MNARGHRTAKLCLKWQPRQTGLNGGRGLVGSEALLCDTELNPTRPCPAVVVATLMVATVRMETGLGKRFATM